MRGVEPVDKSDQGNAVMQTISALGPQACPTTGRVTNAGDGSSRFDNDDADLSYSKMPRDQVTGGGQSKAKAAKTA